jgi:hypothetical protein
MANRSRRYANCSFPSRSDGLRRVHQGASRQGPRVRSRKRYASQRQSPGLPPVAPPAAVAATTTAATGSLPAGSLYDCPGARHTLRFLSVVYVVPVARAHNVAIKLHLLQLIWCQPSWMKMCQKCMTTMSVRQKRLSDGHPGTVRIPCLPCHFIPPLFLAWVPVAYPQS